MRSPLTILRERRDRREGATASYWEDLARELRPPAKASPPIETPEQSEQANDAIEQGLDRLETGGNMIAGMYAKLGEDTAPAPDVWATYDDDVTEPTMQLKVQRKYDGPTCNDCGTPSLVTPCVTCSTREA